LEDGEIVKLTKASKRDNKINRRRSGHREDGRSVFTIKKIQRERALRIESERKRKEELLGGEEV
jgi:hypothetical protein